MNPANPSFGIMDKAYFTSRSDIIDWVKSVADPSVQKIEDTATGAVACKVLDEIYPGVISMSKVKWNAKNSWEYVDNYKLLQQVFKKKGIDKYIDVEKLTKAKYQDNLEFMQWLKRYYEVMKGQDTLKGVASVQEVRGAKRDNTPLRRQAFQDSTKQVLNVANQNVRGTSVEKLSTFVPKLTEKVLTDRASKDKEKEHIKELQFVLEQKSLEVIRFKEALKVEKQRKKQAFEGQEQGLLMVEKCKLFDCVILSEPNQDHPTVRRVAEILYAQNQQELTEIASSNSYEYTPPQTVNVKAEESSTPMDLDY